ncbi:MAG: PilZ domain-containing protein [Roseburia sp.]|uniref:PilZ domain-containing protein n=1 Tax=Roseburia hominis TaxID=301301 RepID=UPI001F336B96|nr:PilZ domain-containing protein [Roseburia hominis]
MKLYEIPDSEYITITVKNEENASLEYRVPVLFCKQEILFVEPIRKNGKMLNFEVPGIQIAITYVPSDGMPLEWRGCTINPFVYEEKPYHIIYCTHEGKHINRRKTYRQYLGYIGTLRIALDHKTVGVTVKDISVTGVSFISVTEFSKSDIGMFQLNYLDEELEMQVQVSGEVVRIEQLKDTRFIYGCRLIESNMNIGKYIARKQKKAAERRRINDLRGE